MPADSSGPHTQAHSSCTSWCAPLDLTALVSQAIASTGSDSEEADESEEDHAQPAMCILVTCTLPVPHSSTGYHADSAAASSLSGWVQHSAWPGTSPQCMAAAGGMSSSTAACNLLLHLSLDPDTGIWTLRVKPPVLLRNHLPTATRVALVDRRDPTPLQRTSALAPLSELAAYVMPPTKLYGVLLQPDR